MQASELFKQSNTVLLDAGMGTMLQASGLKLGAKPEELNITNPDRQLQARLCALRCPDRAGCRPAGRTAGTQRNAGL